MTEMVIFRDKDGKLAGFGDKGRRAYAKFQRMVQELEVGETLAFSYKRPRSPQHHRFFFARMNNLLDMQESFKDLEELVVFLKVGAGLVDFMPSCGQLVAVPKSISWHALDEQEFTDAHRAIVDFLWTPEAQRALWPNLTEAKRYEMVEVLLR
jgi:hypothetical protein